MIERSNEQRVDEQRADVVVRQIGTDVDLAAALAVRHDVFVLEQDVPIDLERDEHDDLADAACEHVLVRRDGAAVATGRVLEEPGGVAHLQRIAVRREERGTGLGVLVVRTLEDLGRTRGLTTAELGAQVHALGFYERLGYEAHGDVFDDAGIPHRHMRKPL
ncbi:MAG TPA: GNAT family N-acetyltransferase [Motilibacteraceae bacterium]|nr:GNAT family N-acetyltransferase [Motilibacteraceae bacterium]